MFVGRHCFSRNPPFRYQRCLCYREKPGATTLDFKRAINEFEFDVKPAMKAAQISKPGADFEIVEREIPTAGCGTGAHQSAGLRRLPQ
jgi:hypothetical protein